MTSHTTDDSNSDRCHSRRRRGGHPFRGPRSSGARKERVLHTRVSEKLSDDIRRFAEDLRVPASNLVRNVLEEVFTIVDDVSGDVGDLFEDLLDEAEGVRDRVRGQSESRKSRSGDEGRRRGRRRGRSRFASDADVEDELRSDEATEHGDTSRNARRASTRSNDARDDASDDGKSGDAARPEAASATELFPEVLGWQPLVLNRDFECGRCARTLGAGESAFLGLGAGGLTEIALCGRCAGRR